LKSTETDLVIVDEIEQVHFSNFGSLKSTETPTLSAALAPSTQDFSNFGSLKSTETLPAMCCPPAQSGISAISAR